MWLLELFPTLIIAVCKEDNNFIFIVNKITVTTVSTCKELPKYKHVRIIRVQ